MVNSVQNITLWAIVLICTATTFGQTDQSIVRLDLKEFPHDGADNGPPDWLPVYVEVATVQPDVEQGIVFTLNIENNSAQTIRIMDPIDRTRIILTGFTHPFSKNIPNTKPDSSICFLRSYSAERIKAMFAEKIARRPFQAYDVNEARRKRHLKTLGDIAPWEPPQNQPTRTSTRSTPLSDAEIFEGAVGGKLTLEPGQHFQAVLQINKVIADREAHKKSYAQWLRKYCIPNNQGFCTPAEGAPPSPKPDIIPIPADKYYLSVSMLLFTDIAGTFTPSFEKSATIQHGEPSNSEKSDAVIP